MSSCITLSEFTADFQKSTIRDDRLYHVTTTSNAKRILEAGFDPRQSEYTTVNERIHELARDAGIDLGVDRENALFFWVTPRQLILNVDGPLDGIHGIEIELEDSVGFVIDSSRVPADANWYVACHDFSNRMLLPDEIPRDRFLDAATGYARSVTRVASWKHAVKVAATNQTPEVLIEGRVPTEAIQTVVVPDDHDTKPFESI